ncbi:MAG: methyltransferase domain-containing protein [Candidatus Magasanikbacteria bacterium]|nr:methyltransferase domain-containing protein [Candidatus Magasanikbacteria bacterium]
MKKFFWQFYAILYDIVRFLKPYKYLQKRILEELRLIPHLDILDSGCGTGNSIKEVVSSKDLPYNIKIFGIDISSIMLGKARRKLKKFSNVNFEKKRTENEAKNKRSFDRIISSNSLYTTKNPEEVIENWYKKLEDGGILVLVNPFNPKPQNILNEHLQLIKKERDWKAGLLFFCIFPLSVLLMMINLVIAKAAKKGSTVHFIEPKKLEEILKNVGFIILNFEVLYGDTCILFSCQKDTGQIITKGGEEILIRRAQTPEEIIETQKLRYEVYCEEIKSLDPKDYPDKIEIDWFDQYSYHFFAKNNCGIIGCIRLIPNTPRGFLLEEEFELPKFQEIARMKTLELSRLSVAKIKRTTNLGILITAFSLITTKKKIYTKYWIAVCQKKYWLEISKTCNIKIWESYKEYHGTFSAPGSIFFKDKIYFNLNYDL